MLGLLKVNFDSKRKWASFLSTQGNKRKRAGGICNPHQVKGEAWDRSSLDAVSGTEKPTEEILQQRF